MINSKTIKAGALLLIILTLIGCDYLEKREIERVLDERARSIISGNTEAYLAFFAPDYEDQWISFDQLRAKAIQRLTKKPLPVISFGKREIIIKGERAMVTERFTFEDKVQGRVRRYQEVQHPLLVRRGEGWICIRYSEILRLLGGRMEEEHEIEQILLRREAALVKEDVNAYMSLVSPQYQHRGETAEQVRENLIHNFQIYDEVTIRSYDRKIFFFGDYATVSQRFTMQAMMVGTSKNFSNKEKFELEKIEEGWKFTKGL